MSLIELIEEERELLNLLESLEADVETEEAIRERREEVLEMARTKVDRMVAFLRFIAARREELKELQKEIAGRLRTLDRVDAGCKEYLCFAHATTGQLSNKLEGERYGLRFQRNSRPTVSSNVPDSLLEEWYEYPALVDTEEEYPRLIPSRWSRFVKKEVRYVLDKDEVLAAYLNGEELPPGVSVSQGWHIRTFIR